jgi:hypothetical protein
MESLLLRIASGTLEAVFAGIAIGGVLALVRKIQIAFGVKENSEDRRIHVSGAR